MGTYGRETHCSSKQRDRNKLTDPDMDEGYLNGQTFCCLFFLRKILSFPNLGMTAVLDNPWTTMTTRCFLS